MSDGSRHFVAYQSLQGIDPNKAVNNIMKRAVDELRGLRPDDTPGIARSAAQMYEDLLRRAGRFRHSGRSNVNGDDGTL